MSRENINKANFDNLLRKTRFRMNLVFAISILVFAFFYGFSLGLANKEAFAKIDLNNISSESLDETIFSSNLPTGLVLAQVGNNVYLGGHKATVATFYSKRPIEELLEEQHQIWQRESIKVVGTTSPTRGMLIGFDLLRRQRYTLIIWQIPPPLQKYLGLNYPFQGVFSQVSEEIGKRDITEQSAESLGLPRMPGTQEGFIFSSKDKEGESRTATFINPGTVYDNVYFYEQNLTLQGWKLTTKERLGDERSNFIRLDFTKEGQLLHFLISPVIGGITTSNNDSAVVNITKVLTLNE